MADGIHVSKIEASCILPITRPFASWKQIVHVERDDEMPDTYQLMSVEVPNHRIEPINPDLCSLDWQSNIAMTQDVGNTWLPESKKAGLLVPSVIVPVAKNCILYSLIPEVAHIRPQVVGRFPSKRAFYRVSQPIASPMTVL